MSIEITLTVNIPQLDQLGERLVEISDELKQAVTAAADVVAQQNAAIALQVGAIAEEIQQASNRLQHVLPEAEKTEILQMLDNLKTNAAKTKADIEANTANIRGIIPDTEPTP